MGNNISAQSALVAALGVLVQRRANTTDPAEKAAINASIADINGQLNDLELAGLLQAAQIVSDAADGLEQLVAAARMGPFDRYLSDLQGLIARLQDERARMHSVERLAPAPVPPEPPPSPAPAPAPAAAAAAAPAAAPAPVAAADRPSASTNFATLQPEYEAWFGAMQVLPERRANANYYLRRLLESKAVYQATGAPLGIPWYVIGILHGMECGFSFQTHLHNGDPLTARTVNVPRGRPVTGTPPFDWRESARDALMLDGLQQESSWTLPRALYLLERFNGFGYRSLGVPTPYLWSFSDRYRQGKFVADHHFDADAVSGQCGAAVMIKVLQDAGAL